jgi:mucin-19
VYTITYRNDSIGPLSTLVINDATPSFTTFVNALCGPLPANLTACSVTTSPAVGGQGGIVWTFTGTLTPAAQGTITFSVLVNN